MGLLLLIVLIALLFGGLPNWGYHSSRYEIVVENPHSVARGVSSIALDGAPLAGGGVHIPLVDDSATHHVRVVLGSETLRAPSCAPLLRA